MLKKTVLAAGTVLLLATSGAMAQTHPGAQAVLKACKPDIARFCSQVQPGQGRVKACMKNISPSFPTPARKGSSKPAEAVRT